MNINCSVAYSWIMPFFTLTLWKPHLKKKNSPICKTETGNCFHQVFLSHQESRVESQSGSKSCVGEWYKKHLLWQKGWVDKHPGEVAGRWWSRVCGLVSCDLWPDRGLPHQSPRDQSRNPSCHLTSQSHTESRAASRDDMQPSLTSPHQALCPQGHLFMLRAPSSWSAHRGDCKETSLQRCASMLTQSVLS